MYLYCNRGTARCDAPMGTQDAAPGRACFFCLAAPRAVYRVGSCLGTCRFEELQVYERDKQIEHQSRTFVLLTTRQHTLAHCGHARTAGRCPASPSVRNRNTHEFKYIRVNVQTDAILSRSEDQSAILACAHRSLEHVSTE